MMTPQDFERLADVVADRVVAKLGERSPLVDRYGLASHLGVSVSTIERLSATGEIPLARFGRRVLYDPAAVIAARMEGGGAVPPISGPTLAK